MAQPQPTMSEQVDMILKKTMEKGTFPDFTKDMDDEIKKYRVFYLKGSLDDPSFVKLLEDTETKGLQGKEIVLLDKDHYVFMSEYFVVLKYMQKLG